MKQPLFSEKEVTLLLGETTGSNIQASLAHAGQISKFNSSSSVLYINTVQTERKLSESVRKAFEGSGISGHAFCAEGRKLIHVLNSDAGELHKLRDKIEGCIWNNAITTVIINSWEFASRNSRYREELIYMIRYLLRGNTHDDAIFPFSPVTVIVYGEAPSQNPLAGKIQRGCYGKLAAIADRIFTVDASGDLKNFEITSTKQLTAAIEEAEEIRGVNALNEELTIDGIKYPDEDEEDISPEERHDRFVNRMRAIGRRDQRLKDETAKTETTDIDEEETDAAESSETSESAPDYPVTSIEELRRTPAEISRMPIHLNSYLPSRTAVLSPSRTVNVHSDMITK